MCVVCCVFILFPHFCNITSPSSSSSSSSSSSFHSGGRPDLLSKVADGLTAGRIPWCPSCSNGALKLTSQLTYKCTQNATEWSKVCIVVVVEVEEENALIVCQSYYDCCFCVL